MSDKRKSCGGLAARSFVAARPSARARRKSVALGALGLALVLSPAPSAAAAPSEGAEASELSGTDVEPVRPRPERDDEPHTIFQVGLGLLALPSADVCPISLDNCEQGETSIGLRFHNLYRLDDFGVGAGIAWAIGLRRQAAAGDEDGRLGREHSRSYFLFEGQFRYYLPRLGAWEWWVGTNLGVVVLNDSWSVLADREPYADTDFVGPRAMTVATEGFFWGLGAGGQWRFAGNWIFGPRFHYANWFLPEDREKTTLGDSASLAGRVDVFDFGLVMAYRVPL